ncbi:MAG: hypothetical protein ACP5RD_01475 [bacterium]|jgi:hypothetical protein
MMNVSNLNNLNLSKIDMYKLTNNINKENMQLDKVVSNDLDELKNKLSQVV